ncbi:MAG TPA: hypothetical protein VIF60_08845 [Burkholderiaceae bacterium]|jgi:hypothetical protein
MIQLPGRWRSESNARKLVAAQLNARHTLRVHALILFLWTLLIAVATARAAYSIGITSLVSRYFITCLAGYGGFICGVALWLRYVNATEGMRNRDLMESDPLYLGRIAIDGVEVAADASGEIVGALGEGFLTGGEGCLPFLVIGGVAIICTLLFVFLGPELLIDIAFEAVLAASLVGFMRLGREPDWLLRLVKKTIGIFLLVLVAMVVFGKYAHKHYPQATTTREVLQLMRNHH